MYLIVLSMVNGSSERMGLGGSMVCRRMKKPYDFILDIINFRSFSKLYEYVEEERSSVLSIPGGNLEQVVYRSRLSSS